jgi:3-hydroxyisobutyrate dehydrogenase-like beta-hydroxyacid dehydrogenase
MGIIGSIWARNWRDDGVDISVWNRTPKDIPGFKATPAEAIAGAKVIVIVVADPPAVDAVLKSIEPVLQPGQIVVQSSTISSHWTLAFEKRVIATGARYVEAPFTGSKTAAEARKTVFYLGGDAEAAEAIQPLLACISQTQMRIGPLGTASALKLAFNMNIALLMESLAESLTFAREAGISDDVYFSALKVNGSHSPMADLKEPALRKSEYAPQFSLKHMNKDLRLALESEVTQKFPLLQTLKDRYAEGMQRGWGEEDFAVLTRLLSQDA